MKMARKCAAMQTKTLDNPLFNCQPETENTLQEI